MKSATIVQLNAFTMIRKARQDAIVSELRTLDERIASIVAERERLRALCDRHRTAWLEVMEDRAGYDAGLHRNMTAYLDDLHLQDAERETNLEAQLGAREQILASLELAGRELETVKRAAREHVADHERSTTHAGYRVADEIWHLGARHR